MTPRAEQFAALESEITEARLRWSPIAATALGQHDWDAELGSRSAEAIDARSAEVAAQIRVLEEFDAANLPEPYRTRHGLHLRKLRGELAEEVEHGASRHSPGGPLGMIGAALNTIMSRDFAPLPVRMQSVTGRLERATRLLDEVRALYESATPVHIDTALQQAGGILAMLDRDLTEWARPVEGADRTAFDAARARAVEAVQGYRAWLDGPARAAATAPVAWGRARMEQVVRLHECVDTDIDNLIQRGEVDLRRHQQRLVEVAARLDASLSPAEAVEVVGKDHPPAHEVLAFTETTLEQLRQFCIDREIIDMPTEVRVLLRETPPFMRATTLAACSTPGMYEQVATESYYYVTPPDPSWDAQRTEQFLQFFNRSTLPLVTAHEAYPGHYVHLSWLRQAPDQVPFTNTVTTTEGWAHYNEQLMIETGWGDGDPRVEIAQIREALLRICRYLAAFGMHVQGWSYDDSVAFFMREGHATRPVAELESRRGVITPNYFAYTLGKHEILELREALRERWGAGFSLKRFHNAFVQEPYPTAVIREKLLAGS